MTWNYRLVKTPRAKKEDDIFLYNIHEVYYNNKGEATAMTVEPVSPNNIDETDDKEARESIIRDLKMMLHDVEKHPIFIPPKDGEWAKDDY